MRVGERGVSREQRGEKETQINSGKPLQICVSENSFHKIAAFNLKPAFHTIYHRCKKRSYVSPGGSDNTQEDRGRGFKVKSARSSFQRIQLFYTFSCST